MTSVLSKIRTPGAKISPTGQLEEKKEIAAEEKPAAAAEKADLPPMLEVRDLKVFFRVMKGTVHAVDGVDLVLRRGETLGLVGESGCGKTTLAYAINRLLPSNGGVVSGSIKFEGNEIGVPESGCIGELVGLMDSRDPLEAGVATILDKERKAIAGLQAASDRADTAEKAEKAAASQGQGAGAAMMDTVLGVFESASWVASEVQYRNRVLELVERIVERTKNIPDEAAEDAGGRKVKHGRRAAMKKQLNSLKDGLLLRGLKKRRDRLLQERVNKIRWKEISMIFQSAMNAFNPVFKVGDQIMEALLAHEPLTKEQARERTIKLFELVGIDPGRIDGYPHEFSGGMKQRAMIAMALACNPKLVLADEPTTALDVIMQDRVLAEIRDLQRKFNMALIIITHDISVVAETANKIAIMYAGHIMEHGDIASIFRKPCNPYTIGLLAAYPKITGKKSRLLAIPGTPPDLVNPPPGCRFHPRCRFVQEICKTVVPPRVEVEKEHYSMCHFAREIHSGELK